MERAAAGAARCARGCHTLGSDRPSRPQNANSGRLAGDSHSLALLLGALELQALPIDCPSVLRRVAARS